jgi:hypothetical protein
MNWWNRDIAGDTLVYVASRALGGREAFCAVGGKNII